MDGINEDELFNIVGEQVRISLQTALRDRNTNYSQNVKLQMEHFKMLLTLLAFSFFAVLLFVEFGEEAVRTTCFSILSGILSTWLSVMKQKNSIGR